MLDESCFSLRYDSFLFSSPCKVCYNRSQDSEFSELINHSKGATGIFHLSQSTQSSQRVGLLNRRIGKKAEEKAEAEEKEKEKAEVNRVSILQPASGTRYIHFIICNSKDTSESVLRGEPEN